MTPPVTTHTTCHKHAKAGQFCTKYNAIDAAKRTSYGLSGSQLVVKHLQSGCLALQPKLTTELGLPVLAGVWGMLLVLMLAISPSLTRSDLIASSRTSSSSSFSPCMFDPMMLAPPADLLWRLLWLLRRRTLLMSA
jgi:hypothetical protein